MRFTSSVLAAATTLSTVQAQNGYKGFNYGSTFGNNAPKLNADFAYEFNAAKNLPNTNGGYTSARLYTMIQANTTNTPIEAIQAAIDTKTKLLLGLWASAGSAQFANEIAALKAAISQYGSAFTDLVVGISVGSEDLYRITPTGIANNAGVGAQPNDLVSYIQQTRSTISGTGLSGKPVGHVDTWTAYVNASNNAVISNLDFLGVDAYPYFQTTMANSIGNANQTFYDAYHQTVAAAQGKPVWVTETGWPITGATQNQAVASADNARVYWEDVACSLTAANINFFYYDLQEAQYSSPSPDFGIYGAGDLGQLQPRFDLSCGSSAKPVSVLFSCLLIFFLSPLFLLLLYNVSTVSRLIIPLLPAKKSICSCNRASHPKPTVYYPSNANRLVDLYARANGVAKLPTATSSGLGLPTSTGTPRTSSLLLNPLQSCSTLTS